MEKKLLILLLFLKFATVQIHAQWINANLSQADPRLSVEMKYDEAHLGFQWVSISVTNTTSDKLKVRIEYTAHGVIEDNIKSMYVGGGYSEEYYDGITILPGHTISGDQNYCLMQYYGKCGNKALKIKTGLSCISYLSYRIISIENITAKEKAEAEAKAKAEAERLARIAAEKEAQKKAAAEAKAKAEAERLARIAAEKEAQEKAAAEAKAKAEAERAEAERAALRMSKQQSPGIRLTRTYYGNNVNKTNNETEENKNETNSTESNNNNANNESQSNKLKTETKGSTNTSDSTAVMLSPEVAAFVNEQRRKAEDSWNQQMQNADSKAVQTQKQNEYDAWKQEVQNERNQEDLTKASASVALFTILGGFIYRHMGRVEPGHEYQSPKKGEKPYRVFLNSAFGFSATSTPLLYESKISTMVNGVATNKNIIKGDQALYLNLGGDFQLGMTSDHFTLYGNVGGKFGLEPTFHGGQTVFYGGGGADFGTKPVKIYGRYTATLTDEKNLNPFDVEDNGKAEFRSNNVELEYGIKFTTNGKPSNNFKRTHIYFGLITKTFKFNGGSSFYFDPINKYAIATGDQSMSGFNFEIRQDHNFKLFLRGFSNHLYIGKLPYSGRLTASIDKGTAGFFEIGFLRCIDLFTK